MVSLLPDVPFHFTTNQSGWRRRISGRREQYIRICGASLQVLSGLRMTHLQVDQAGRPALSCLLNFPSSSVA